LKLEYKGIENNVEKPKVDVCFTTYNYKFTNFNSKRYPSSPRSSSCTSNNYASMKKTYLRKVTKEQFVLALSYQFLKVITSTSMLVILR